MTESVHLGHMGVENILKRARGILFWPRMSAEITKMILECGLCLEWRNANPKEPLISHNVQDYPWENIATNLFTWNNEYELVVVNYFSRYVEAEKLYKTTIPSCYREDEEIIE